MYNKIQFNILSHIIDIRVYYSYIIIICLFCCCFNKADENDDDVYNLGVNLKRFTALFKQVVKIQYMLQMN